MNLETLPNREVTLIELDDFRPYSIQDALDLYLIYYAAQIQTFFHRIRNTRLKVTVQWRFANLEAGGGAMEWRFAIALYIPVTRGA